jgi:hypothetical protein
VLVGVPSTVGHTTVCARTGRLPVTIIAPPPGDGPALVRMLDVADLAEGALDVAEESAVAFEVGDVLAPGYQLVVLIYP